MTINLDRLRFEADLAVSLLQQAIDPARCPADLVDRMAGMAEVHARAAWRIAQGDHGSCPGCSGVGVLTDDPSVLKCERCGGFFTVDPITFEQAMQFVALGQPMLTNAGPDGQFYFDLFVNTSWRDKPALGRVHGWADARTKRVVQFG